jgi:16S rRNA (guanine1207-N2)-methyltransferase
VTRVVDFAALRRFPDLEAPNLEAVDAADRYLLDEAAPLLAGRDITVIGDNYGAITLGALGLGATAVRVHQDALSGELALANNAAGSGGYSNHPLDATLVSGAELVLLRLPRGLDALDEIAQLIANHASPGVTVIAGGRVKHMTIAMNAVLERHFERVDVTLARQKSRLLIATRPKPSAQTWPRKQWHDDPGLWVCATGAAFAGTSIDMGTRLLLEHLDPAVPEASVIIDLGCGTGVLVASVAASRPHATVIASDQSAAAVASATLTMEANGLDVAVVRDDALSAQRDASAGLILLNPPFHIGATVHAGIALKLFTDAARALEPGGELWSVWNSHLGYRSQLEHIVGPTRQIARNPKFTITASTKASAS